MIEWPEHLVRHEELTPQLLFSEIGMLQKESKVDLKHSGGDPR